MDCKEDEMDKLEKVIKGLECCIGDTRTDLPNLCTICPYARGSYATQNCSKQLREDALELLKSQESHLIPYEKLDDYEVVWLQIRGFEAEAGGLTPWIQTDDHKWFSPYFPANSDGTYLYRYEQTFDSYGEKVRAWTSRPTDAKMEAVKWK